MHIVTGAAGFVGSHVVEALNDRGVTDILAVDIADHPAGTRNLDALRVADLLESTTFRAALARGDFCGRAESILHQGACADTMETDEAYMTDTNVQFSRELLDFALAERIPFVYASSASVYGAGRDSAIRPENENPLNLYARSKLAFDEHVRTVLPTATIPLVGLRYFNVYGPREAHKGRMASMPFQLYRQLRETGAGRLFEGIDGYGDGEQRRDFLFAPDAAAVNLHFLDAPARRGIYNVGTGASRSFNDIARILIQHLGRGRIEYVPFPDTLRGKYQSFTEADLSGLREAGCELVFTPLEKGLTRSVAAWEKE